MSTNPHTLKAYDYNMDNIIRLVNFFSIVMNYTAYIYGWQYQFYITITRQ